MSDDLVVTRAPHGRPGFAVRVDGRLWAAPLVILDEGRVTMPGAVEVPQALDEHPADAALRSVFPAGSRVSLLGTAGTVERAESPTLRSVRLDGGGLTEGVELRDMRAL